MVKLYALSTCPWCKKVKQLLTEQGVPFECVEVDIVTGTEQEQALEEVVKLIGVKTFPVTVINGTVIKGYQPEKIMEALQHGE